jgi:hypothetical protein
VPQVDSSWIYSVDYYPEGAVLIVRFKDKKTGHITATCRYENVDPIRGFGLLNAPSKGTYFHASGLYGRQHKKL